MEIKQMLVSSDKYNIKCPYTMNPEYITVHGTGNDASAKNEISYMVSNNSEVSYHISVDNNEAIQGIPFNRNAWHCGDGGSGKGNRSSIGIEICYDRSGGVLFDKAENNATIIVAQLMKQFNIPISKVVQHNYWSGKDCPHSIRVKPNGWNTFIARVKSEYDKLNNNNKEKVEYEMKNIVVYGNAVDKRCAEYLADYLNCPCFDGNMKFDYSKIENVYCVGGEPSVKWTGYAKKIITGSNRYETLKEVLRFMGKL